MTTASHRKMRKVISHGSSSADLLVEIGTEELPATYLDGAIAQLRDEAERLLREAHLEFAHVESFGTPRRLALLVRALGATQHNPPEEIRGPSKHAAFDAHGNPTGALTGFLKARGGAREQIAVVSTDKGDYVYLRKPARQRPTKEVAPQLMSQLLGRLRFPKTMRWDDSGLRFARPIRWLVTLYGPTVLRVRLGRLQSGRVTRVGGPKRPKAVSLRSASGYAAVMARAGILLDHDKRTRHINGLVKQLAKPHRGVPAPETVSHGLLDEVSALVEQPVAMVGQFDRKYLALPREVLLASMAKHQRVFAMQQASGTLLPTFVAILDGKPRKANQVCHVYEHILSARLADGLLFWNQDQKRTLEEMSQQLSSVTFYEDLGSVAEKADRMHKLAAVLKQPWKLSEEQLSHLRRACELAKADLVSTVVKEFPTLQGIIGKYYAGYSKEPSTVAEAIGEHYLPAGSERPKTLLGSALAILDKYDTLSSHFSKGRVPTGDQDPLGLRRAAQGIVEVAWAIHNPLPLDQLLEARATMSRFSEGQADPAVHKNKIREQIRTYLAERLYTFAWPAPVPSRDLIDAVLTSPWEDLVDAMDRIQALQSLDGKQALLKAAKVIERTHNILKSATVRQSQVDQARLQEPLERTLWDLHQTNEEKFLQLIQRKSYQEATTLYGEVFFEPLHEFFDQVMVNVKDEAVQQNRLALLRAINALYTERVADLSKLVILQTG